MKELVYLDNIEDAKELVRTTSACDFEIDLTYGSIDVDAKSIMGVLSLDFTHPWNLVYNGKNDRLEAFINDHEPIERAV